MRAEEMKILNMLAEGKITAEQAERLLDALGRGEPEGAPADVGETVAKLGDVLGRVFAGRTGESGHGWGGQEEYRREETLTAPMPDHGVLVVETHNGAITAAGAEVDQCQIAATIRARAGTAQDAEELAEKTALELVPSGDTLTLNCHRPAAGPGRSVSIHLKITLPRGAGLKAGTHNGPVWVSDLAGEVNARTHNGPVSVSALRGDLRAETHNGPITAERVSGSVTAQAHNGPVNVTCFEVGGEERTVSLVTHNGPIAFAAPADLSAEVDASTDRGPINTDFPIPVEGKVGKKLKGTIGAGAMKLHLRTHNGPISIRKTG